MPLKKTAQNPLIQASKNGLTVTAYRGDEAALIAFDLAGKPPDNFAGFAVKRIPPKGEAVFLQNRLNFVTGITKDTPSEKRAWTPSDRAPFQKFYWMDFPYEIEAGKYTYEVSAKYLKKGALVDGEKTSVSFEMAPEKYTNFDMGFTRGYVSSQAYVEKFKNAPILPPGKKTPDFDTKKFADQYRWLGFHARQLIFDFLDEALADKSITLDLFAYDIDEPDIIKKLALFGPRLRAFLDNAPLHTKPGAVEPEVVQILKKSAGEKNIEIGHFKRFAHNKVLIQKKNGKAVKALTGSANFSVRGLYVQSNNVLVFKDPEVAGLYEEAFDQAFNDPSTSQAQFPASHIASQYFSDVVNPADLPNWAIAFSPHQHAAVSLDRIAEEIQKADSSILFAIMELGGKGKVLDAIKHLDTSSVFTYGVTQAAKGLEVFKPGSNKGLIVPFSFLNEKVPAPFQQEWNGGMGQVIHHKFVVADFNDANPVVFTGSSNLASGGEEANGDNLLAIADRGIATAYAVEAIRLVDHYHFRSAMRAATDTKPLLLKDDTVATKWWEPYYDKNNIKYTERLLFTNPKK
jgi:phosphatidylserine/phosphatidylglycerophosphate/cardiolipin synthase-like enzyme